MTDRSRSKLPSPPQGRDDPPDVGPRPWTRREALGVGLGGVSLVVLGAGEDVTVTGWSELPPRSSTAPVVHDPVSGVWELTVAVPARGWTTVEVLAG